jgi:CheY-like chemotaxis protein
LDEKMKGRATILIVESDPFMRQLLQTVLDSYELLFAEDGVSGLKMAKELKPDLIILEPLIPKLDGFQLCSSLKQDPKTGEIPVLMFTILSAKERAEQVGADCFLMKPLNRKRLLMKIKEMLRNKG